MTQTNLSSEQLLVLEKLVDNPESQLREIHQALVDDEETRFEYSPDFGENYYNDERETVQERLGELQDAGLAEVDGRGKPWYPTPEGRKRVE